MEKNCYEKKEIIQSVKNLSRVFDVVRLVDATRTVQFNVDENENLVESPYECYAVWNKCHRCDNCISAKAMMQKKRMTKYEFVDEQEKNGSKDVYHVVSQYVEVDNIPYALEIVSKITDEVLLSAYGRKTFVETIEQYNKKLYTDALTGSYNRSYYEEQLSQMKGQVGFAIIDIDKFKGVNDTYGHEAGDAALKMVASNILSSIRQSDSLIRYGGDEFVLIINDVSSDMMENKLETVMRKVRGIRFAEYPELRLSLSIGSIWSEEMENESDVMSRADKLLYRAKESRDRYVLRFVCNGRIKTVEAE